jgi:hypothetical protein
MMRLILEQGSAGIKRGRWKKLAAGEEFLLVFPGEWRYNFEV